jgi:hypothetical protein
MRRLALGIGFWLTTTLVFFSQEPATLELPVTIKSPTLPQAERALISKQFQKNSFQLEELRERLRYAFQELGYFKVEVEEPVLLNGQGPRSANVMVRVTEGKKYRLRSIKFKGSSEISVERMRPLFPMQEGDLLRPTPVREGLDGLRRLFGREGYINFTAVPETVADDSAGLIDLVVQLDPDKRFRFGPLVLNGPEPHAGDGKSLVASYQPLVGKWFDVAKLEAWFDSNKRSVGRGAQVWSAIELSQESDTITVRLSF